MKRFLIVLCALLIPALASAQLKSQTEIPDIGSAIVKPGSNLFLGFIDPSRLHMSHTFSSSYMTFGGNGVMFNSYMNTIDYQISNPFFLRLNLGLINSPYNSFTDNPAFNDTKFFGGAELQYRPNDKTTVKFGVNVAPGYDYLYSPLRLRK